MRKIRKIGKEKQKNLINKNSCEINSTTSFTEKYFYPLSLLEFI
jgi:hypothetical protein